jgi:formamidopyrimidine-DNA glycosylase
VPELPDVTLYLARLRPRLLGQPLEAVRNASLFLLRSVDPPLTACVGKRVTGFRRLGKRIAIGLEEELYLVFHLMIAGRFRWRERGAPLPGRLGLAAFDFPTGTLLLTEAGTQKRASLYVVRGEEALLAHDPGGLDPLLCTEAEFAAQLVAENHTLKRALCAPALFSGIGNAYSDEILHRARLSPVQLTRNLSPEEIARLHAATRATLEHWIARLDAELGDAFPEKVTAFREGMAVHGRYGEPCPDCGAPVQRIVYASNETNYCARCQTGGKLLADRALSRLLKSSWPKTLEELG